MGGGGFRTGPSELSGTDWTRDQGVGSGPTFRQGRGVATTKLRLPVLGITPAHLSAAVTDRSRGSTGDPLELLDGHHHDGNPHIPTGTAEVLSLIHI